MNDTTAALSLLLNDDFLKRHMPGYNGLRSESPFGDTIIFKSDSITGAYLPASLNGFHFKLLTPNQICALAIAHYDDTTDFPDFLQLNRLQEIDSAYYIALQATCVIPRYNQKGQKILPHDTSGQKCIFGMLCGGGIAVTVYRERDKLKIRKEASWSD